MAVKLLVPKWGFAAGTIVRDLPERLERDMAAAGQCSWHLAGGTEQPYPTVPANATQLERNLILRVDPDEAAGAGRDAGGNIVHKVGIPAGRTFYAPAAIFRLRASGATAATVTVSGITGSATTTLGTLTVPAGGSATDFYDHGHDAYQWTSTATDTVVEVM